MYESSSKHQKWAYANVEEPRNPSHSLSKIGSFQDEEILGGIYHQFLWSKELWSKVPHQPGFQVRKQRFQVAKEVEPKKQKVGAAGATLKHRMQSSASENCPKGGQTGQVLMNVLFLKLFTI